MLIPGQHCIILINSALYFARMWTAALFFAGSKLMAVNNLAMLL